MSFPGSSDPSMVEIERAKGALAVLSFLDKFQVIVSLTNEWIKYAGNGSHIGKVSL